MNKNKEHIYYGDYLKLKDLLSSQNPESKKAGNESHDETLFIIVHQVYELWFKQIIHELNSIIKIFDNSNVNESEVSKSQSRLERIIKIQKILIDQLDVMESMSPMDFLEFRDLLIPASGFQSVQFREIEIKLGLGTKDRIEVDREYFLGRLNTEDRNYLIKIEEEESLFSLIGNWLERMPFSMTQQFDFWKEYESSVNNMLNRDQKNIIENPLLGDDEKKKQLIEFELTKSTFETLLNKDKHDVLLHSGKKKLSHRATLNALFIMLYREKPILNIPYRFLNSLMDIDECFTTWRYRHALMAHRLLGTKIGTGGSSGHQYLKRAAENNRAFKDLYNLSTYIIPRFDLPKLPTDLEKSLSFYLEISD